MLPLKVRGDEIVDTSGNEVRLRGFCVGGWMNMENFINGYPAHESEVRAAVAEVLGPGKGRFFFDRMLDYFLNEDDIRFMASLGCTVLRIPMNYRHFEDDSRPFEYKPAGLKRLDRIVAACRENGIYVILDLHAAQGWQNPDWHSDNPTHKAQLWTQRQFQDRVVGLWAHLAGHYRREPAVAGYNLLNEPVCGVKGALRALYARTAKAIRKVDPDHMLFLDGNAFSKDFSEIDPDLPNTVYSSHNYVTPSFTQGEYPGKINGVRYDRERLRSEYWRGNAFMRRNGVPTWVGEFGSLYWGLRTDRGRLQAVDDMISIFEEYRHHWTIWTYKDVGAMGTAYVRPDSEYVRRTAATRKLKTAVGTDTWLDLLAGGKSVGAATVRGIVRDMKRLAGRAPVDYGKLNWDANRIVVGLMLSGALLKPYAEQFRGMTEKRIDRMMQSFALKNCAIREEQASVIRKWSSGWQLAAWRPEIFKKRRGRGGP